jgi:hypothetical protein
LESDDEGDDVDDDDEDDRPDDDEDEADGGVVRVASKTRPPAKISGE